MNKKILHNSILGIVSLVALTLIVTNFKSYLSTDFASNNQISSFVSDDQMAAVGDVVKSNVAPQNSGPLVDATKLWYSFFYLPEWLDSSGMKIATLPKVPQKPTYFKPLGNIPIATGFGGYEAKANSICPVPISYQSAMGLIKLFADKGVVIDPSVLISTSTQYIYGNSSDIDYTIVFALGYTKKNEPLSSVRLPDGTTATGWQDVMSRPYYGYCLTKGYVSNYPNYVKNFTNFIIKYKRVPLIDDYNFPFGGRPVANYTNGTSKPATPISVTPVASLIYKLATTTSVIK